MNLLLRKERGSYRLGEEEKRERKEENWVLMGLDIKPYF